MSEKWGNRYFAVCAAVGALLGAACGLKYGAKPIAGQAGERFFHPIGLFLGAAAGAILGAAFAWQFVYSRHPDDTRDSITVVSISTLLGAIGGAFVGRIGWRIVGSAMLGWLIVGIVCVIATHHILGMIYGALFGAPLGAILALRAAMRADIENPSKSRMRPPAAAGVWDADLDAPTWRRPAG
jgi:hypothetical protein